MNQSDKIAGKQTQLWWVSSFVKLFWDEIRLFNDVLWGNLLCSVLISNACLPKLILIILLGVQRNKLIGTSALLITVSQKKWSQTVLERKHQVSAKNIYRQKGFQLHLSPEQSIRFTLWCQQKQKQGIGSGVKSKCYRWSLGVFDEFFSQRKKKGRCITVMEVEGRRSSSLISSGRLPLWGAMKDSLVCFRGLQDSRYYTHPTNTTKSQISPHFKH